MFNNLPVVLPLVVSALSGIVSILAIANFVHSRKQEAKERQRQLEEDAVWKAGVNQQLAALNRRVDSHNRYAEMFREYGEDIAFIRGQLERK